MSASVRDFARVAWFWLNRGNWNGRQVLPRAYFDENMRPQVPKDLPVSVEADERLSAHRHLRRRVEPLLQIGARHLRVQLVVQRKGVASSRRAHLARCSSGHGHVAGASGQQHGADPQFELRGRGGRSRLGTVQPGKADSTIKRG